MHLRGIVTVISVAITAFQSTKIGSIEIRLHANISIFPSVNILCDEYLDGLSKAEIGQILLHSCIYTGSKRKAFLQWCRAGTRPFPVWIC